MSNTTPTTLAATLRAMHAACTPAGYANALKLVAMPERMADLLAAADALEKAAREASFERNNFDRFRRSHTDELLRTQRIALEMARREFKQHLKDSALDMLAKCKGDPGTLVELCGRFCVDDLDIDTQPAAKPDGAARADERWRAKILEAARKVINDAGDTITQQIAAAKPVRLLCRRLGVEL